MSNKATYYISPSVQKALKRRTIETDQTQSAYVERAVAQAIAEDLADIEAIDARASGATETLDDFIKALKQDGLI